MKEEKKKTEIGALTGKPRQEKFGREELNIKKLKKKLAECQKLKDEYLAGWQRSRADFLNYKKEEMKRIGQLAKYAAEELILKILPILDNFEIAIKEVQNRKYKDMKIKEIIQGFSQIKNQIKEFLKSQGVEEIKCLGEKFNPEFHEVAEEKKIKDKQPGIVVEEVRKGYKLHDKVLRPSRVKIAK